MARFPFTLDSDTTEVRDALEIGRTQYSRGDLEDAMRWLRRAADIAREQRADDRAVSLTRAVGDLGPPRPPAAPPRATESVRPRAPESLPVNPAPPPARAPQQPQRTPSVGAPAIASRPVPQSPPRAAPARPVTPSNSMASVGAPRATASAPPASASTPPSAPSRPLVASRPVPIPSSDLDVTTDSFRFPGDASNAEPILLTARKVEPFELDDDSTHVGAAPAGFLAAVAAEAQAAATKPAPTPPQAPAAKPVTPSSAPATQRAPLSSSSAPAARVAVQRSAAKPSVSASPRASESPANKAPASRANPTVQPAPQPALQAAPKTAMQTAVAGTVSIADDEEEDQTSPGILPQAIQAMRAAAKVKPAVHQAMRVALSKGPHGVIARALTADGLRDGEVEVMVVGVSSESDIAALFS